MKSLLKQALALGAMGFALAGCQSKAEEEVYEKAEAISESYDAEAKLLEARAKNAPDEERAEREADELRKEGDAIEKQLKEDADRDL